MAITAAMVKELREMTGAGMMDCKKALTATEGDMDKAMEFLREKGLATAQKKASRIAAEGIVMLKVAEDSKKAVAVEVNAETDFVAKNAEFQELVANVAAIIVKNQPADLEVALKLDVDGKDLETVIAEKSGKIGEKLSLRRFVVMNKADDEVFGAYSHMGGKMSALVKASGIDETKAKDVAMQVAAINPQYIDRSAIPAEVLDRELTVLKAQAMEENANAAKPKPENIIEKMVQGRLNKNLQEICLVDQAFIKDSDLTVAKYLGNGKVLEMVRFEVGEGMEKREENFAEEVAAQMKG